jgi:hypothetical protein
MPPTTTSTKKRRAPSKPSAAPSQDHFGSMFLLTCTDIVSRVGLPGFLMIAFVTFVFSFSSSRQKEEIIDKWVLFNNNTNSQTFAYTVVIFAVIIYLILTHTFIKLRALDRAEIDRLSEYKTRYQEEKLKGNLKSSGK